MFKKLLVWFMGYLEITIRGGSPEKFINLCKNNNTYIWNLKNVDECYRFELLARDYKDLKPIAKKTHTLPEINKKIGFPFILNKYKKRKAFILGILLFSLLIYVLSLNIWNISVKGGRTYTSETILEFLESQDIYIGKKINDIDCRKIEENIRETYTEIGWVSAEIKGTNLIINLKETMMPTKSKSNETPSHITATKNGIITKIVTRSGTPMVDAGDVVKKGDILVSGVVEIIGDNDILLSKEAVVADADIYAKTYYEYEDTFKLSTKEKEYTGDSKTDYIIRILFKERILYKHRITYTNYDIITEESIFQPLANFYLPLSLTMVNYNEYIENDKTYTKDEAINVAKSKLTRVLNNLKENDVIIHDNDIKFVIDKDSCTAKGNIIVEESIIDFKTVNESEWRIQPEDEFEGDKD